MGCIKSKSHSYLRKDIKVEFADKRSQISRLYGILKKIDELELSKFKSNNKGVYKDKYTDRKRACYFSQMIIFIKWLIKVVQVNQEDSRIDQIILKLDELILNEDEFILNSLENKIKHLINTKNK